MSATSKIPWNPEKDRGNCPQLFKERKESGLQWLALAALPVCIWGKVQILDQLGYSTFPGFFVIWWRLIKFVALLVAAASIWQALQPYPRWTFHHNVVEGTKMFLQLIGDTLLTPYYAYLPAEKPVLGYQETPQNKKILDKCLSLESFKATPWLRSTYAQFIALMVGDFLGTPKQQDIEKWVRREVIETPDGGLLALDWWEPAADMHLIEKAGKICFIASTWSGDSLVTAVRLVADAFTKKGWRCVIMVKRGCGLTYPNQQPQPKNGDGQPLPWCLMGMDDCKFCIDHVASVFPGAPICGVGLSTGGGQVRGLVQKDTKLAAAVIIDAAPEWEWALDVLDHNIPLVGKALGEAAQVTYAVCGRQGLPVEESKGFKKVLKGGIIEFVRDWQAPAFGYEHSDEGASKYMWDSQPPMASTRTVPTLELMSLNDSLVSCEMIERLQRLYKDSPNVITCLTTEGTHMVRWEGWWPKCWISRASVEFLDAVLKVNKLEPAASKGANGSAGQKNGGKAQQARKRR